MTQSVRGTGRDDRKLLYGDRVNTAYMKGHLTQLMEEKEEFHKQSTQEIINALNNNPSSTLMNIDDMIESVYKSDESFVPPQGRTLYFSKDGGTQGGISDSVYVGRLGSPKIQEMIYNGNSLDHLDMDK